MYPMKTGYEIYIYIIIHGVIRLYKWVTYVLPLMVLLRLLQE